MRFTQLFALSLLSLAPSIHSLPAPALRSTRNVVVRQNDGSFSGPQTVHTVNTANTAAGTVTTTCDITLTPVQGPNGESLVQEDQNCQISVNGQDTTSTTSNNGGTGNTGATSSGGSSTTSTDNGTGTGTGTDSSSASDANSSASSTTTTSATAGSTSGSGDAVTEAGPIVNESPLSAASAATDSADASPTAGSTTTSSPAAGALASDVSAANSAISATGTSANDTAASATSSAFVIPGRTLSVLPIGLGVFAGISVIALIVVGLVTYERTKYRRAFRQRRLAEQGANMGYGGAMQQA